MLSNELVSSDNTTLVENGKIRTVDKEIAEILSDFPSNIIKTLNIPQTSHSNSNFVNVRDPLIAILKYYNHGSILAIK